MLFLQQKFLIACKHHSVYPIENFGRIDSLIWKAVLKLERPNNIQDYYAHIKQQIFKQE